MIKFSLRILPIFFVGIISCTSIAQVENSDEKVLSDIYTHSLTASRCYENLRYLCKNIGKRLSGSEGAARAVAYSKSLMDSLGVDTVYLQEVWVPHWERGSVELCETSDGEALTICALGGSVGTPKEGIEGEVVYYSDYESFIADSVKRLDGKLVFIDGAMPAKYLDTFHAYSHTVVQRSQGAIKAAKRGAIGVLIRSLTLITDDNPHTGGMKYEEGTKKIPGVALSTKAADRLEKLLAEKSNLTLKIKLECKMFEDVKSYNVIGEIRGSEFPNEIIVVGGHLDAWDNGEGAHDDGAGCMQSIEVLRTFKKLNIIPKRTLRAVLFMNEENGLRGGIAYGEYAKNSGEKHLFAIESDRGAFTPKGFDIKGSKEMFSFMESLIPLFKPYQVHVLEEGGGGADISTLAPLGTTLIGYIPDSQRYFDYHHAPSDVFEAINKRELELGAASMSSLCYLLCTRPLGVSNQK